MKKIYSLFFYCFCGLNFCLAQNQPRQVVVTLGGGYGILNFSYIDNYSNNFIKTKSSPVLIGNADVAITNEISLGVCGSYQSFNCKYVYYDYTGPTPSSQWFTDELYRYNIGARILNHFSKNNVRDIYAGLRLGYTVWQINTNNYYNPQPATNGNTSYPSWINADVKGMPFTAQFLFGFRYYFVKNVGLNAEASVGGPNFFMIGVNGRF